jgi:hypothetical protein
MPILVPVLKAMGIHLVWFGIIMVIMLEAALVSPPEGLRLYIIQGIRKCVSEKARLPAGPHSTRGSGCSRSWWAWRSASRCRACRC